MSHVEILRKILTFFLSYSKELFSLKGPKWYAYFTCDCMQLCDNDEKRFAQLLFHSWKCKYHDSNHQVKSNIFFQDFCVFMKIFSLFYYRLNSVYINATSFTLLPSRVEYKIFSSKKLSQLDFFFIFIIISQLVLWFTSGTGKGSLRSWQEFIFWLSMHACIHNRPK